MLILCPVARAGPQNCLLGGSAKRPDIIIRGMTGGSQVFCDMITCPVGSPDTLVAGATTLGAAAEKGHRTKRAAWEVLCASQGDSFLPLATECTGYTCDNIQTLFDTALENCDNFFAS